jgi:hypothetical protein
LERVARNKTTLDSWAICCRSRWAVASFALRFAVVNAAPVIKQGKVAETEADDDDDGDNHNDSNAYGNSDRDEESVPSRRRRSVHEPSREDVGPVAAIDRCSAASWGNDRFASRRKAGAAWSDSRIVLVNVE